jgi:nucleotide-binding universal stress UspA family protein
MLAAAGRDADLLVLGSRGQYGPLRRTLLGSVAAKLARTAPCAMLVTPA